MGRLERPLGRRTNSHLHGFTARFQTGEERLVFVYAQLLLHLETECQEALWQKAPWKRARLKWAASGGELTGSPPARENIGKEKAKGCKPCQEDHSLESWSITVRVKPASRKPRTTRPPLCGPPLLSTRRDEVRQPFSRTSSWLPRAVVIGLALTVVPTGTEHHRRVP